MPGDESGPVATPPANRNGGSSGEGKDLKDRATARAAQSGQKEVQDPTGQVAAVQSTPSVPL
jgi:hypothetical protein